MNSLLPGFIFLLLFCVGGYCSQSASYAMSFMNISNDGKDYGFTQIYIISNDSTIARIQSNPSLGYDKLARLTVDQNFFNATLRSDSLAVVAPTTINQHKVKPLGLIVSSSADCNVFGIKSDLGTTDGYFALPLTPTSTEFFIAAWPCSDPMFFGGFQVVSAFNDTRVEVYRIDSGKYHLLDVFFLAQFDVLTYTSGVLNASYPTQPTYQYDVTGLYVNTSKPVGVYGGNACASVQLGVIFCDHVVEQIPPVDQLGTVHIVPPVAGRRDSAGYVVRAVSTKDNTSITWSNPTNDVAGLVVKSAGEFAEIWSPNSSQPLQVTCSKPCVVMQYNTGRYSPSGLSDVPTDPFMLLVVPVERFDQATGFSTANSCDINKNAIDFANFVAIIVNKNSVNNVFLDGVSVTSWNTYPGWNYATATLSVRNGEHRISTTPRTYFAAYAYGHSLHDESSTAYGYTAAFRSAPALPANSAHTSDSSPSVDDIFPKVHIITGGTTVFLSGHNFNLVNVSQLVVTLVHTWRNTVRPTGSQQTEKRNFTSEPCLGTTSSLLTCIIPLITLPDEFINITDTTKYAPPNNISSGFSSFWTTNSTLEFYVKVQFDETIYPWNRTNDLQFIYRLPTLIVSGLQTFMPFNPSQVDVKGSHLSYGVTLATDYRVMIGDGQCQPQGQLTDNLMHCLPPTAQPQHSSVDIAFCRDDFALIVELRVSRTSLGLAGCLNYQPNNSNLRLAIVLGAVLGGVGLMLLIIVLIVAIRCCSFKRPTPGSKQSAASAEYRTHIEQFG